MLDRVRVAVVTPYCCEDPDVLLQCLESVAAQSYECTHVVVADGQPASSVSNRANLQHIVLPRSHADNGNVARCVGSLSAMGQGYDAIAYLDADNWYQPDHIAAMVALHERTNAIVCTASRTIHRRDGTFMYVDAHDNDGASRVDTSCLWLARDAYDVLPLWAVMPKELSPLCDRVFWSAIRRRRFLTAHHDQPTVCFRTQYAAHYEAVGEVPPAGAKTFADLDAARAWANTRAPEERERWR